MNESIKMFFLGFMSGSFAAIICFCGCHIYLRATQRASGDSLSSGIAEQGRPEGNTRLEDNNEEAADLIQKAKNILDNGKCSSDS